MKKSVIFTSRDVGAANQILPVVKRLKEDKEFEIHVIASDPALEVFEDTDVHLIPFIGQIESEFDQYDYPIEENDLFVHGLINKGLEICKRLEPEIIITGQSSMGFGVDEIFIYIAKKKKNKIYTYTFLDFWSGGNSLCSTYADDFFVIDDHAKALVKNINKDRVHVVGSPRHQIDPHLNYTNERILIRDGFEIDENTTLITFFAQSSRINGYFDNYTILIDAISSLTNNDIQFKIKSHPKESGNVEELINYAIKKGVKPDVLTSSKDNSKLLIASDLIFICSSMIGLDHAYFSSYSNIPIGCVIYLSVGDIIKKYMQDNYGFEINPLADDGIGFIAHSYNDIKQYIKNVKNGKLSSQYFKATKKLQAKNAVGEIIRVIQGNL